MGSWSFVLPLVLGFDDGAWTIRVIGCVGVRTLNDARHDDG